MKKLTTTIQGGHPLTLDDFGFINDMVAEMGKGIFANYPNCILKGCELGFAIGYTISAGYLVLNGEVCQVDAHNTGLVMGNPQNHLFVHIAETTVAPSPVHYKDNVLRSVHINRKAIVNTVSAGGVSWGSFTTFEQQLANKVSTGWIIPVLLHGWVEEGHVTVRYKKVLNTVYVQGIFEHDDYDAGAGVDVVCNFPAGFRPSQNLYFDGVDATGGHVYIEIATNGDFSIGKDSNDDQLTVNVSNIFWLTD